MDFLTEEYSDHIKGEVKTVAGKDIIKTLLGDNFNHTIIFFKEDEKKIYHMTGYENKPTLEDISQLYDELRTDEEFAIPERILKGLDVDVLMTKEIEEKYDGFDF